MICRIWLAITVGVAMITRVRLDFDSQRLYWREVGSESVIISDDAEPAWWQAVREKSAPDWI